MHRLAVAAVSVGLAALPACGTSSYTLDELEGSRVAHQEFSARGLDTAEVRALGPLTIDGVDVGFTLDGWNFARAAGFEYVSEGDSDFREAATDLGAVDQVGKLQAAVDASLAGEPNTHILILRTWSHETQELAEDQLRGYVDDWLTSHGL